MKQEELAYTILLGGNEGDTVSVFELAKAAIINKVGVISSVSSLYGSPPWGFEAAQDFLNQVIVVQSILSPEEVMGKLLAIENELGRKRSDTEGYTSRVIDLDILFQEETILTSKTVELPHPRIQERRFTLLPLVEIRPEFIHPIFQKSLLSLLEECSDESDVFIVS